MAKLNLKTVNKKTKDQLITFVLVIAVYIVVQIMVAAGAISSLMQGLLVPMCTYSIVAIGLNLCVGYLGELSIGHAGFMCVGAFSSAFCTKLLEGVIGSQIVLFIIAAARGYCDGGILRISDRHSGLTSARRLSCDCDAGVWMRSSKISSTFFISQKTEADSTLQSRTETRLISQMTVSG